MKLQNNTIPLSIKKIFTSNQPPDSHNGSNMTTKEFIKSPPLLIINHQEENKVEAQNKRQIFFNKFPKFFKKQIKTHDKRLKKNPRIKLIQNTQRLINPSATPYEKYILHSTKRLKVINQSGIYNSTQLKLENNNRDQSLPFDNASNYITIAESMQKNNKSLIMKQKMQEKRKKSQQSNRIFKGITSRRDSVGSRTNNRQRLSLELQKYRSSNDNNHNIEINNVVNNQEQDFIHHKRINLYHSLVYGANIENKGNIVIPSNTKTGQYAKIQRNHSPNDSQKIYIRGKTRENERKFSLHNHKQHLIAGFPTKKVESGQPQVLTIQLRRGDRFRHSLAVQKMHRNSKQYYQPRPVPISNINIFKRPNTTIGNINPRRHSQIQPW